MVHSSYPHQVGGPAWGGQGACDVVAEGQKVAEGRKVAEEAVKRGPWASQALTSEVH